MAPPFVNTSTSIGGAICLLAVGTLGCAPASFGPIGPGEDCASDADCGPYVCRHVEGLRRCVEPDYDPNRHRDGCALCPDACEAGVCVDDGPGLVCEFDDECPGELCISGRCDDDPRGAGCLSSVECAVGMSCVDAACVSDPGSACVADADCGAELLCAAGTCIAAEDCAAPTPDLTGTWTLDSNLSFDDALPPTTRALLDAVAAPLAFLMGDLPFDEPLLRVVATPLASTIREFARANLPEWFWPLLTLVGELEDALGTMEVREALDLELGDEPNRYRAMRSWEEVSVTIGGETHRRPTSEIAGFVGVGDASVVALCGRFVLRRHVVEVGMGALAAWAANQAVRDATGDLFTIDEVVAAAARGFCDGVARATEEVLPSHLRAVVRTACEDQIEGLSAGLSSSLREAREGTQAMVLRGDGAIRTENELSGGSWRATMDGSELSGDFAATR